MDKLKEIINIALNMDDDILEEQVKNSIVIPLLDWLNVPENVRGFEFPVWSYNNAGNTTHADIAVFSSSHFDLHLVNNHENIQWVQNHCLLVVETKRPNKIPTVFSQAQYYCDRLGAIAYICTDGKRIIGYYHKNGIADQLIIDCSISELPETVDQLFNFRFEQLIASKHSLVAENISEPFDISAFFPNGLNFSCPKNYIPRLVCKETHDAVKIENISLLDALQHDKKILLIDSAGTGKTVELQRLAYQLYNGNKLIPIYYSLKNYTGQTIEEIERHILNISHYPQSVLLLDGYDEIESKNLLTFPKMINNYTTGNDSCRIIITSRSNFVKSSNDGNSKSFEGFSIYTLHPLSEENIQHYLSDNNINSSIFRSLLKEQHLSELIYIPFFLSNLCMLYKKEKALPNKKQLMLTLIQESMYSDEKKYNLAIEDFDDCKEEILNSLAELGFAMQCMQIRQLDNSLYNRLFSKDKRNLIKYSSLWSQNNSIWSFEHNHFQEFLAAFYLKDKSHELILNTITCPSIPHKIRESWVNTVNHLLSLIDGPELIEWITKNDKLSLLYIEHTILNDDIAESIFYDLFEDFCQDLYIISSYSTILNGLSDLVRTSHQISYLINKLNNLEDYYTAINTLKLLSAINYFGNSIKIVRNTLISIIQTTDNTNIFVNAVEALCNKDLFTNDDIRVIKGYANNADRQLAALRYIRRCQQFDQEIAFVANLISSNYPEELSVSFSMSFHEIVKGITCFKSLITLLRAIPTDNDINLRSDTELVKLVFDKASDLYTEESFIFLDEIYEFYYKSITEYSVSYHVPIKKFLSITSNTINCYKYMAEKHPDIFDFRFLLIDTDEINSYIQEYENDSLPNPDYFISFAKNQPSNSEYFERLANAIFQKTGERIDGIIYPDYRSEELAILQEIFDSLFNRTAYLSLIHSFLEENNLSKETSFNQLRSIIKNHNVENTRKRIIIQFLRSIGDSDTCIIDYPSEINWEIQSAFLIVLLLKHKKNISIDSAQDEYLRNLVIKLIQQVRWENEMKYCENVSTQSYNVYIIPYLASHLDLDLPEEQYIDLLCLPDVFFSQNQIQGNIPEYLKKHLAKKTILQTIKRNIEKGIVSHRLAYNYISYCNDVKSDAAIDLAYNILEDNTCDSSNKWQAMFYLVNIGQAPEIIDKHYDTSNHDLLNVMASILSTVSLKKHENMKLITRLETENQQSENIFLFIPELISMNSRYGLEVYTQYVRDHNAVPEFIDKCIDHVTESIGKVTDFELHDLIKELFVLSFSEGFRDNNFRNLQYCATRVLENFGENHFDETLECLTDIRARYNSNKQLFSQCSYIIYSIKSTHYHQKDTPLKFETVQKLLQNENGHLV